MFKTIIALALMTSSCSVVKASEISPEGEQAFAFDKESLYKTRVLTNEDMIYIEENAPKNDKADEKEKSKVSYEAWKTIINKDR